MSTQRPILQKRKLALAVSLAILSTGMAGCNSSSSSSGPKAVYTFSAIGGSAGVEDAQAGMYSGAGGHLDVYNTGGSGGAEISAKGAANTKFKSLFKTPTADLGDNPLAISADTTIPAVDIETQIADGAGSFVAGDYYTDTDGKIRVVAAAGPAPADYAADTVLPTGTPYLVMSGNDAHYHIRVYGGGVALTDTNVTGLSVAAGATLTLAGDSGNTVYLYLVNDLQNDGVITKAADGGNLYLYADQYIATGSIVNAGTETHTGAGGVYIYAVTAIANSGEINASGFDNTDATTGGPGGSGAYVRLDAQGYVLNSGMLDSTGGDGKGAGAQGGNIYIYGAYVENSAHLNASGGSNKDAVNTVGNGGTAGRLYMDGDYLTYNTGDIDLNGGDGTYGGSGPSCCSRISNSTLGEVINSGKISLNGGTGLINAGSGGYINIYAYGGNTVTGGDISAKGGDTTATTGGNAERGGRVQVYGYYGEGHTEPGDVVVSGNIDISGGSGPNPGVNSAGYGGEFSAYLDGAEGAQTVSMLGYTSIDVHGGDGGEISGDGGEVMIHTRYVINPATQEVHAGPVMNDVPVNARGGNNSFTGATHGGQGGMGGLFDMYTSNSPVLASAKKLKVTAENKADIDLTGGTGIYIASGVPSGYLDSGYGGEAYISAYSDVTNSGNITANYGDGGEGTYATCCGGGTTYIYSQAGKTKNSGDIAINGGYGAEFGRNGGSVYIYGETASNTGDISVNGGNATNQNDATTPAQDVYTFTYGGDGGEIYVQGVNGLTGATNSGTLSYVAGTGIVDGQDGCVQINITFEGVCGVTP